MRLTPLFTTPAILLGMLLGTAADARAYRNLNYGIAADIPDQYFMCTPQDMQSGSDHGFNLLIDDQPKNCVNIEPRRQIFVFAYYNTLDTPSLKSEAKLSFRDHIEYGTEHARPVVKTEAVRIAPKNLRIDGQQTFLYRVEDRDGNIAVSVIARNMAIPARLKREYGHEPYIFYEIALKSTKEHIDEDLAIFRTIVPMVHIFMTE